jgi:hypothetical protein
LHRHIVTAAGAGLPVAMAPPPLSAAPAVCYSGCMRRLIAAALLFAPLSAVAQSLPARAPGLWQSTTTVTGSNGQPLPNASNVVTVSCVDAANDQKFFLSEESRCSALNVSGGGQTYAIDGTCNQRGQPVRIAETLTYDSPQALKIHAVLTSSSGPITIASTMSWQGPCVAGMQPGDEGSLVAGAFSKADNINDVNNQ